MKKCRFLIDNDVFNAYVTFYIQISIKNFDKTTLHHSDADEGMKVQTILG